MLCFVGYAACLYPFYVLCAILLKLSSATIFDLCVLCANLYNLLFGILLFSNKVSITSILVYMHQHVCTYIIMSLLNAHWLTCVCMYSNIARCVNQYCMLSCMYSGVDDKGRKLCSHLFFLCNFLIFCVAEYSVNCVVKFT